MESYYDCAEPIHVEYFADKKPGTPERSYSLRSLDENELVIRLMNMLQDHRLTREEHHWWCTVLESIALHLPTYGWSKVQAFFFRILRELNQQTLHVGTDMDRYSSSYFSSQSPFKPAPLVRLTMVDRGAAETVTMANYFCRYYSVTGRCPQKGVCPLLHSCILCFERTGKKFYHALQHCMFSGR